MPDQPRSSTSVSSLGVFAGAGALLLFGLVRRNKSSLALATAGGLLAWQQARSQATNTTHSAQAVFRINTSAADAYRFWRDFQNLPRFMAHIESVRVLDDKRSEWTARGPFDASVSWTAEITDDQPGSRIAWRSLPGSQVSTRGRVEFRDDPQGRGSTVRAEVQHSDPLGPLGRAFLTLLGKSPEFMVKEDLRRFKALLETGEAPTTAGQTHGPRRVHGHTEQVLFRETSNHPAPQESSPQPVAA